jgi:hypothetical protein
MKIVDLCWHSVHKLLDKFLKYELYYKPKICIPWCTHPVITDPLYNLSTRFKRPNLISFTTLVLTTFGMMLIICTLKQSTHNSKLNTNHPYGDFYLHVVHFIKINKRRFVRLALSVHAFSTNGCLKWIALSLTTRPILYSYYVLRITHSFTNVSEAPIRPYTVDTTNFTASH